MMTRERKEETRRRRIVRSRARPYCFEWKPTKKTDHGGSG
jgi:hypothetical protein